MAKAGRRVGVLIVATAWVAVAIDKISIPTARNPKRPSGLPRRLKVGTPSWLQCSHRPLDYPGLPQYRPTKIGTRALQLANSLRHLDYLRMPTPAPTEHHPAATHVKQFDNRLQ